MATTRNLRKAVRDEEKAVQDYQRSADTAQSEDKPVTARKFRHVRKEEKQHKREFSKLLKRTSRR
jgi:rubrerythrin